MFCDSPYIVIVFLYEKRRKGNCMDSKYYKENIIENKKIIEEIQANYTKSYNYKFNELEANIKRYKGLPKNKYIKEECQLKENWITFCDYEDYMFGKLALSVDDFLIIEGRHIDFCKFKDCQFECIIFRNCSFSGTEFKNVVFNRVIFDGCMFTLPILEQKNSLHGEFYNAPTSFIDCAFWGVMINCQLEYSICERCNFTMFTFKNSSLQNSVFESSIFSSVCIQDCNLCNTRTNRCDIFDISFTDEVKSIVNEKTFFDYKTKYESIRKKRKDKDINIKDEIKNRSDLCFKKSKSFRGISRIFEMNNLNKESGEIYYQSKLLEKNSLTGIERIKSYIAYFICGYGERPSFTLVTIAGIILIFSLIYMLTGINTNNEIIKYTISTRNLVDFMTWVHDYGKCIFFSVTTFSTVGYGNYLPIGTLSTIFAGIQMILGVGLSALWTGCILRKLLR